MEKRWSELQLQQDVEARIERLVRIAGALEEKVQALDLCYRDLVSAIIEGRESAGGRGGPEEREPSASGKCAAEGGGS